MKKWAVIDNGKVVNIILWDGESNWKPQEHQTVKEIPASDDGNQVAGIGWEYSGGIFIAPPEPEEPEEITTLQEV